VTPIAITRHKIQRFQPSSDYALFYIHASPEEEIIARSLPQPRPKRRGREAEEEKSNIKQKTPPNALKLPSYNDYLRISLHSFLTAEERQDSDRTNAFA
jgi:hypothetical protein